MVKRVTLKDVAARAGVSFSTVSRALNDRPEISTETKAQVRAACKELGYIPNIAARSLVSRRTRTIGLLVPDISNDYFAGAALAIEEAARENGYRVLLCNSLRDSAREAEAVDALLSQQVEGLIVAPVSAASADSLQDSLHSLPHVYLGNNHGDDCSYVVIDNKRGAYEATRYLLCLGHRNILYLGGRQGSLTRQFRVSGFYKAMEEVPGAHAQQKIECDCAQETYRMIRALLGRRELPDAVFAYSDRIALQVLQACVRSGKSLSQWLSSVQLFPQVLLNVRLQAADECGVDIPKQLSLVGFDNISYASLPRINLTTVSQHKRQVGRTAVLRLFEQIQGKVGRTVDILQPELIIRGTCHRRAAR